MWRPWVPQAWGLSEGRGGGAGPVSGCGPGGSGSGTPFLRARALHPRERGRGGGRPEHAHGSRSARARSLGAGTRGGAKRGPPPPRAPMYAFYSLLIYIFYSLFRRDGGAAATGDPEDPAQVSGARAARPALPFPGAGLAGPRSARSRGAGAGGGEPCGGPRLRCGVGSGDLDSLGPGSRREGAPRAAHSMLRSPAAPSPECGLQARGSPPPRPAHGGAVDRADRPGR